MNIPLKIMYHTIILLYCTVIYIFPFLTEVLLTYNVTLILGAQHTDSTSLYATLCSPQIQLPSLAIQHYCNTIDLFPILYFLS